MIMFGKRGVVLGTIFLFVLFLAVSCEKSNPTKSGESSSTIDADSDAAECVSSAVGENTGGLMDGVGDLFDLSSGAAFQGLGKTGWTGLTKPGETADVHYDPSTGLWTVSFSQEYGNPSGIRYAYISRTYTIRFLDKNGQFQRRYITSGDTAATIEFNILSGSGRHMTLRLSQKLNSLSSSFIATGTNTSTVTINGTYQRAATDTLTTQLAKRTLDYTLNLTVSNLTGPRGSRLNLAQKISGSITGTFQGHVTFEKGDLYNEKDISRNISITVGNGTSAITINGKRFINDLVTGELEE
jgi:hypothetical protein